MTKCPAYATLGKASKGESRTSETDPNPRETDKEPWRSDGTVIERNRYQPRKKGTKKEPMPTRTWNKPNARWRKRGTNVGGIDAKHAVRLPATIEAVEKLGSGIDDREHTCGEDMGLDGRDGLYLHHPQFSECTMERTNASSDTSKAVTLAFMPRRRSRDANMRVGVPLGITKRKRTMIEG